MRRHESAETTRAPIPPPASRPPLRPFLPDDDALLDREPVLELEQAVFARRGEAPALEVPTLSLRGGAAIALTGDPLGVEALLRAGFLLLPPRAGRCRVLGEDIRRLRLGGRARLRRRIAYVGAGAALDPALSLAENLGLRLRLAGAAPRAYRSEVERVIVDFELGQEAGRTAAVASFAARRAVVLGRALLAQPALLIGETPFDGLTPAVRERALWQCNALRLAGTGCLFAGLRPDEAHALEAPVYEAGEGGLLRAARRMVRGPA